MFYCSVHGCKTNQKHMKGHKIKLHCFPFKDKDLQQKWIDLCCLKIPTNIKNARVCSLHFAPTAYSYNRRRLQYELKNLPDPERRCVFLLNDAVPTRNLPRMKDHPVKVLKLPQPASPPRDIEVVEVKEEPTCREEPTCTEEDPEVLPLQEHDPLAIKPEPVPWQPSGSQEEPQPQESHAVHLKEEIDIKEEDINSFNTEDIPLSNSEKKKKKHLCLPITQKVRLLKKLDSGVSVKRLTEEFGVGTTTIYDLKKQKDRLLKFYSESDEQKLMKNRKTLHRAKNEDLDRVLLEWIRRRRSEHFPLNGMLIMKQAKIYHQELNIEGSCEYSAGWLQKFKKRHGIKHFKVSGGKASANDEAAEKFIDEFGKLIADENLTAEQVYNAAETSLFWRYCPRKILNTAGERAPAGVLDAKDRLTVLGCANAAGTHKCKLAVVGKSPSLKGKTNLAVHYYANKRAWITRDIFSDWFHTHFVPAARAHCREARLAANCKILLLLDNCSAHPPAELLIKNNVYAMYFPPNVASLIQPCEQGILRSLKSKYKGSFLNSMLAAVKRGVGVEGFQEGFNVKDAVHAAASAWNDVSKDTLAHAWHSLWPVTMFSDDDGQGGESEGLHMSSEKKMMSDLLTYAKSIPSESVSKLEEEDVEEVFDIDNDAPVVHSVTDGEIAGMVLNEGDPDDNSGDEDDIVNTEGKVSIDNMVKMCDGLIKGLEQHAFITKQEIMSVYKIKERLLQQKPLLMGQMTLQEASKKAIQHSASSSPEHLLPGPSPAPDAPMLLMMYPLPQVS